MKWALVENNIVTNIVVWDGKGDLFSGVTTVQNDNANIGDIFLNETLYSKPLDGYDYDFDFENKKWVITPESAEKKEKDDAFIISQRKTQLLGDAKNTISIWQTKLLLGIIKDDEKQKLVEWLKYIDAITAIDTTTAPDIDWPEKPV